MDNKPKCKDIGRTCEFGEKIKGIIIDFEKRQIVDKVVCKYCGNVKILNFKDTLIFKHV